MRRSTIFENRVLSMNFWRSGISSSGLWTRVDHEKNARVNSQATAGTPVLSPPGCMAGRDDRARAFAWFRTPRGLRRGISPCAPMMRTRPALGLKHRSAPLVSDGTTYGRKSARTSGGTIHQVIATEFAITEAESSSCGRLPAPIDAEFLSSGNPGVPFPNKLSDTWVFQTSGSGLSLC